MSHSTDGTEQSLSEIPIVDWLDLETDREKFLADLRYALSECGFLVLTNAPGLEDEFQQRAFKEVRSFFDAPMDLKKTAHISNTPRVHMLRVLGPHISSALRARSKRKFRAD